ncbi:MAG: hypothetical protein HY268_15895 [Deltaproteobacteria bacterium]|nr:hypothetical protein [Deltaproteobacteria bacterium]
MSHVARASWSLGYPDQALKRSQEALTLAQELSHPQSLAFALFPVGLLRYLRGEGEAAREPAEALIALSLEQGFAFFLATGTMMQGWALAEGGQKEEGIAQMRQGLSGLQATGAELPRVVWAGPLAEAYGKVGRAEEGLPVLSEALAFVDKTGGRFYEAELYRLKGKLVLQSGVRGPASENPNTQHPAPSTQAEAEAEACFLKAIDIARKQHAKSLELRAAMSLSRLWQQQGKKEEAHQLLAEIYGWFTEGFDTVDLQEAQALLEELS